MIKTRKAVKLFLTVLTLLATCLGIAGVWGYVGPEAVGKAIGTMALVGGAVFVIDGLIYGSELRIPKDPTEGTAG